MRRILCAVFSLALVAAPVFAVDPGKAEGALMIDGRKFNLVWAYAVTRHKNQLSGKNDNTLLILTDQALPADARLHDLEATLPDGTNGVMVCDPNLQSNAMSPARRMSRSFTVGTFSPAPFAPVGVAPEIPS